MYAHPPKHLYCNYQFPFETRVEIAAEAVKKSENGGTRVDDSDQAWLMLTLRRSTLQIPALSSYGDRSSTTSDDYSGIIAAHATEMSQTGRDIAPFEPVSCEVLIQQIRTFSPIPSSNAPPHSVTSHLDSVSGALRDAAVTIRYNAKWFAEPDLAELLEVALEAAAASSASVDLYSGVELVDVVGIYSALPPQSLLLVARFLAQTHYNATRANKTRKLADRVWVTMRRVLESHLGVQYVAALLQMIREEDYAALDPKVSYARLAAAVNIISEKLLFGEGGVAESELPTPQTAELLDSLQNATHHGNEHVQDLIMDAITTIITRNDTTDTADMDWHKLLAAARSCIDGLHNRQLARGLVGRIATKSDRFESTDQVAIAWMCIDISQPLSTVLREALLSHYAKLLPVRDWSKFHDIITPLSRSDEYTEELQMLMGRSIADFTNTTDAFFISAYAETLQQIIERPATTKNAAAVLGNELVRTFTHCIMSATQPEEFNTLFDALCDASKACSVVTKSLLLIRADAEGAVYYPIHGYHYNISGVRLSSFDATILHIIQDCQDWEIYNHIINELPALLSNHALFDDRSEFIQQLREIVCEQVESGSYLGPPKESGLTKSHVAAHLIETLTAILSYHHHLTKQEMLSVISTVLSTAGSRDYIVSIPCIHALTICCYELPDTISGYMDDIIDKMSKLVTQRYLAIHVLLFLAGLSRLPDLFHSNFRTQDYKKIFGVCGSYLQSIRGSTGHVDLRQIADDKSSKSSSAEQADALPQYVYALTHHVIAFWYIALKPEHRREQKDYITSLLRHNNADGETVLEDQGLVTIDLMDRIDADHYHSADSDAAFFFDPLAGRITLQHRLIGLLLITTETSLKLRETKITVRRPTGTATRAISNWIGNTESIVTAIKSDKDFLSILPYDPDGTTYGRIFKPSPSSTLGPIASELITTLPDDDAVTRAIQSIDRTPGLDSHKAGVIYIGEGQKTETEILQNVQGSPDYITFLSALGTLRPLHNAPFNTQGLDRTSDADGPHAIVWNNQVTELVFHITTLMPNDADPSLNTANKKRHIGNDFVNIIFNNSSAPFDLDTFPSQFAAVYIVIAPSARTSFLQTRRLRTDGLRRRGDDDGQQLRGDAFFSVRVLTKPGYPAVSSAATEKIVSAGSLPGYVRNLALNDCVFAIMWHSREGEGGEYPSSWRSRLEQLRRLKERFGG
ncbi:Tuberous sclerosis 2-like protein [Saxophila tyrrhenica]|uniref:Tuberous sclerosis 2-like protein n=1 Tax=Saxophila tyrrhenica TaxID=1690608 RepID=A0AAV9PG43_9PEZI|nr:Tuberous sclerosis 2-like protein [Saxophila tyrrhenica]